MSKIEVNTVEPQCGTTLPLGGTGDTVQLGSGASQTGFGRTGTVDWQTTPKTGDFTGANGEGYFINTTAAKITMTLPTASAGDIISIQDYNNTFDDYSFVIQAPSGVKINGGTASGLLTLSTEGQGLTLVYVDSTVGWRSIESTTFSSSSGIPTYIAGCGGNTTLTVGDFKTHIFTSPGTFTVCSVGNCAGSNTIEYAVVAGGGGGSFGGGGAGGFRQNYPSPTTAGLPVTATGYPVTVGGAGTGIPCATSGDASVFAGSTTITSAGGGRGGGANSNIGTGADGGSGGGGGHGPDVGGSGNTPATPVSQGENGGTGSAAPFYGGGGGGGATSVGTNGTPGSPPVNTGGNGGTGNYWPDAVLGPTAPSYGTPGPVSSTRYFAGGGGGSYKYSTCKGIGGSGGGGNACQPSPAIAAVAGTINTGGGGGGGNGNGQGGGSGIVMIRYKYQ